MKIFSIIHIPPLSFFSKDLYKDVAMNWRGVNFLYLLLLLAICWIPVLMKVNQYIGQFVDTQVSKYSKDIPKITITNGEVSIDEPQPYLIKNPDNNSVAVIIDTTGKTTSLEKTGAFCLLTKNALLVRQSDVETRAYSLSQVKHFILTGDLLMQWAQVFKKVFVVFLYPAAVFGSFIYRVIQALIYAAIGLLFASWCRITLTYETLIRLAIVAVTPCIIINTVLWSAGTQLPLDGLIYLPLALAYLFFGVKTVAGVILAPKDKKPPEDTGAV